MSSPPPNKKRKIESIEKPAPDASRPKDVDTSSDPTSLSQLPLPILGSVMDYLRYGDVRKAILVSRNFCEAAKHVQTLNLCKTVEMHIPSARRFTNVTEINILCFLKSSGLDMGEDEQLDSELDQNCLRRIIPFLAAWPGRLEKVFIGGLSTRFNDRFIYWPDEVILPEAPDHFDIYQSLIESFCGAFETGALPGTMKLEGIRCLRYEERFGPQCLHCLHILRQFPLRQVLESLALPVGARMGNGCISDKKSYEMVTARPRGKELMLSMQQDLLSRHIFGFSYELIDQYVDDEDDEEESYAIFDTFMRRMTDAGVTNADHILHLAPEKIQNLQTLLGYGCKPQSLSREFIKSKLRNLSQRVLDPKLMISKKTFDELVRMGFLFEEGDFVVVDVFTEPVFRPKEYDFLRGE